MHCTYLIVMLLSIIVHFELHLVVMLLNIIVHCTASGCDADASEYNSAL